MSAAIIPFPDKEARELFLNGYYRPQDDRQSARDKLLAWADRFESEKAAREAESREYSKRLDALRAAGVPPRSLWALANKGMSTLSDIAQADPNDIKNQRNVGKKTVAELKALLLNNGFALPPSWDEWDARQG
jgi:DNA-directed RNA polymerase alpha subunit